MSLTFLFQHSSKINVFQGKVLRGNTASSESKNLGLRVGNILFPEQLKQCLPSLTISITSDDAENKFDSILMSW
jgi:hypothetical protein